jgi:hypothetical protein
MVFLRVALLQELQLKAIGFITMPNSEVEPLTLLSIYTTYRLMPIYMSGEEVNPLHPLTIVDLGIQEQQMSNVVPAHPLLVRGGSVSTTMLQGPFLTQ